MAHLSITQGAGRNKQPATQWDAQVTDAEYHGQSN